MLAEQLLDVVRQEQSEALLLEAERELGQTLYFLGELVKAREYQEQSVARYHPEQHGVHAFVYGQDPKIACLIQDARALSLLGCVDKAQSQTHAALMFAQQVAHPYSAALAHYHEAVTYQILRDWQRTQELAEATITIAVDHGFPYWRSSASVLMGWAFAQQGRLDEGLALIQQGLADCAEVGAALNRPYSLTLLAEALVSAQAQGGHFYQAEMLRLRGELLLHLSNGMKCRKTEPRP
jgi:predicted ATPase